MVMTQIDTGMIAVKKSGMFINTFHGNLSEVAYKWIITGNTYPYKDVLKETGADYNGLSRTWHFNSDDLPASIANLVDLVEQQPDPEPAALPEPPANTQPGQPVQIVEKVVEKIIEKEVVKLLNVTHKRKTKKPLKGRYPRRKAAPAPAEIIKPSYWDRLMRYLTPGRSRPVIALVGGTGNGKTVCAEAACESLHIPYLVIDCNDRMEAADLIGAMTYHPQKGEIWRDGPVTKAFREGKAVILNEYDTLDPRTGMALQSAFQTPGPRKKSRYITLSGNPDEDRVFPNGDCPLILTMNTYGNGANRQYTGRNTLDAANLDRISVIVTEYENEALILTNRGFKKPLADQIVTWARNMRERVEKEMLRVTISNRLTQFIAESIALDGLTFEQAIEEEFFLQIDPSDAAILRVGSPRPNAFAQSQQSPFSKKAVSR